MKRAVLTLALLFALLVAPLGVDPALAAAPGELDPSFGEGGVVRTYFSGINHRDAARALALQPDGKIVALGEFYDALGLVRFGTYGFVLARYNPDGSQDRPFARGWGWDGTIFGGGDAFGRAVALQPDGKIVVGGWSQGLQRFALERYYPDGRWELYFTAWFGSSAACGCTAVAVQPDGKFLAAGWANPVTPGVDTNFALMRFTADGEFDPAFINGGVTTTNFLGNDTAQAMVLQPDGKIVLAGSTATSDGKRYFALIRYNGDGSFDRSFANGGAKATDFAGDAEARAVAVQPDGKIVAAGVGKGAGTTDFALARYNPDGSYDTAFGDQGRVRTDFGGKDDLLHGMALAPDGKIVAVGFASDKKAWEVARYNTDGSLDPTFGSGGKVVTQFADGTIPVEAYAVAVQPDGRIVLAGRFGEQFALARYLSQ